MNHHASQHHMTEEQLDLVLSLFEAGTSPEDIVKKFPGHREEVIGILRTAEAFMRDAENIVPSKDFFASMLERVTEQSSPRYSKRGISSIISSLQYIFDSVTTHARIALPAVAAVLLIVVFAVNRPETPTDTLPETARDMLMPFGEESITAGEVGEGAPDAALKSAAPSMMAMQALPPATGNPDDALAAFSGTFEEEEALIVAGDSDIAAFIAEDGADMYQNFYAEEL